MMITMLPIPFRAPALVAATACLLGSCASEDPAKVGARTGTPGRTGETVDSTNTGDAKSPGAGGAATSLTPNEGAEGAAAADYAQSLWVAPDAPYSFKPRVEAMESMPVQFALNLSWIGVTPTVESVSAPDKFGVITAKILVPTEDKPDLDAPQYRLALGSMKKGEYSLVLKYRTEADKPHETICKLKLTAK